VVVEPVAVTRRSRVRDATVAEIKATARTLLVAEGPEALTLRAIARAMGMTAPALYRYFDSHEALVGACCMDLLDEITETLERARDAVGTDDPVGRLCATGRPAGAAAPTAIPPAPAVDRSRWPCLRVPVWDIDPVDGGAWMMVSVVAPDAPAGTFCGA